MSTTKVDCILGPGSGLRISKFAIRGRRAGFSFSTSDHQNMQQCIVFRQINRSQTLFVSLFIGGRVTCVRTLVFSSGLYLTLVIFEISKGRNTILSNDRGLLRWRIFPNAKGEVNSMVCLKSGLLARPFLYPQISQDTQPFQWMCNPLRLWNSIAASRRNSDTGWYRSGITLYP